MLAKQEQASSLTMRGLEQSGSEDAEWMGMVAEVGSRCGGLERSEFDCGSVGDANLPETLEDGLESRCRRRRRR